MFRCGYVTIVGKPNVGKSTLLNTILGEKISAISPKPQTTRKRIRGIYTGNDFQIIFQDCPGFTKREDALNAFIREEIKKALEDSDVIGYVTDARKPDSPREISEFVGDSKAPVIVIANKIDLVGDEKKKKIIGLYRDFDTILISALHGYGVDELIEKIKDLLPERPPLFPEDYLTDQPIRFLASEIIREKVFLYLEEELPYSVYVSIEDFDERDDLVYIRAFLYVERESQKGIVIGSNGNMIKKISMEARKDIEHLIGKKVYLELRVKVHKKWSKKTGFFKRYSKDLLS